MKLYEWWRRIFDSLCAWFTIPTVIIIWLSSGADSSSNNTPDQWELIY